MKLPEGPRGGTDSLAFHVSRQWEEQEAVMSLFTLWPFNLWAQGWNGPGNN